MSQLFRLKNGTVLLSTEAPGGIYNSGQLKKIAELCSKELAIVKATEDQRLALFVKESEVENVARQLRAMGLGFRHYQDNLHQPVSCLGELCEEHEQPAMATAMDITKEIASIQLTAPLKIGINGCARCCTPCHTLDIAIVGDSSGYRISLGGKTKQMPEFASYFAEGVPPKELPKRLKAVIETYKKLAEEGETLHDVIERCGVADFVQALAPYSQDAAQREDPFAKEAAAESVDDLALVDQGAEPDADFASDAEFATAESEEALGLDEDASQVDLDTDLGVDDDLSIADEQLGVVSLDEIPIERGAQGSLEDDLALGSDDSALELSEVDFEEETTRQPAEAQGNMGDDSDLDLPMTPELDDELDLEASADITEDNLNLDEHDLDVPGDVTLEPLDETVDLDMDESLALDGELSEDLEGMPIIDEDLPSEELPVPAPVAKAPAPAAMDEEFGEEIQGDMPDLSDEEENQFEQRLQASIDEESALIAKADKDPNVDDRQAALNLLENTEVQEDDLDAIEIDDAILDEPIAMDDELEVIGSEDELETIGSENELEVETVTADDPLDSDLDMLSAEVDLDMVDDMDNMDEELEPINESMEEFPEPGPSELTQIKSRQLGQKLQSSPSRQQFKLSALTFQDERMRVTFDTGAYVDFDLSALSLGEERKFRLGVQNVSVTSTSEGYILEVDGMRLFHPKTSLPAAS